MFIGRKHENDQINESGVKSGKFQNLLGLSPRVPIS